MDAGRAGRGSGDAFLDLDNAFKFGLSGGALGEAYFIDDERDIAAGRAGALRFDERFEFSLLPARAGISALARARGELKLAQTRKPAVERERCRIDGGGLDTCSCLRTGKLCVANGDFAKRGGACTL
jgi:hypothetical protein